MKIKRLTKKRIQWFLDAAVQNYVPLFLLRQPTQLEGEIVNFPRHDFSEEEIVETLAFLFQKKYIEVVDQNEQPLDSPSVEVLLGQNLPPDSMFSLGKYYRLSPLGAQYWEEIAKPDWSRFHTHLQAAHHNRALRSFSSCIAWTIGSRNQELIEEIMRLPPILWPMLPGSDRWQEVRPWRATYWKSFPVGFEVTISCIALDWSMDWSTKLLTKDAKKQFRNLYSRCWYSSPWH